MPIGFFAGVVGGGGGPPPPGPNLVTNGTFDSNAAGWSLETVYGAGSIVSDSAQGLLSASSGAIIAYQAIATVVGVTYEVTGNVVSITGPPAYYGLRKSDNSATTSNNEDILVNATGAASDTFVATATMSYITLQCNGGGASTRFDNIVCRTP